MFLILQLSLLLFIFCFINCFSFQFSRRILHDLILDSVFCIIILNFLLLICNFFYHIQYEIEYFYQFNIQLLKLKQCFFFDNYICLIFFFVCLIAVFVILFSIDYMQTDPFFLKFISYLFLFTFFMLILITGQNFIQLFLGQEGVGLCSFLLIGFQHTRVNAHKSAVKALVINRIGDIFLLFACSLIFFYFRTLDFSVVFLLAPYMQFYNINFFFQQVPLLDIICFFFLIGAVGKSAQIGLHTQLPDAMEGPTPVSALIHAATMVTAGIFLIIKCSFLFEYCEKILLLIFFQGGLTAIFASTIGLAQYDIKKVIAYSTCSQLGLMFCICGLSCYSLGFFHLLTHACFKALLFLTAGALIHQLQDEQDFRKYGNLFLVLPFLYNSIVLGSLALMGFPFLAGYYSKDLIIESIFLLNFDFSFSFKQLICLITLGTCLYSLRLIRYSFFNYSFGFFYFFKFFHTSTFFIFQVLNCLIFLSIFIGFLFSEIFAVSGNLFFNTNIFCLQQHSFLLENEFLNTQVKLAPLYISIGIFFFFF